MSSELKKFKNKKSQYSLQTKKETFKMKKGYRVDLKSTDTRKSHPCPGLM